MLSISPEDYAEIIGSLEGVREVMKEIEAVFQASQRRKNDKALQGAREVGASIDRVLAVLRPSEHVGSGGRIARH